MNLYALATFLTELANQGFETAGNRGRIYLFPELRHVDGVEMRAHKGHDGDRLCSMSLFVIVRTGQAVANLCLIPGHTLAGIPNELTPAAA